MLAKHRGALALSLGAALLFPAFANAAPTIVVDVRVETIQRLVDSLIAVPEVRAGLQDGETLGVRLTDGHYDDYSGTIGPTGTRMTESSSALHSSATHTLSMSGAAAVSLANAYDPANTAKLLIKGGYVGLASSVTPVQLAFNALVKTPADTRLASYDPKAGDSITHGGCTGTLGTGATAGYLEVELCGAKYVVNSLGGVNGKIPNIALADICRTIDWGDGFQETSCRLDRTHGALSGGDQWSIRETCRAAFSARPSSYPDSAVWDYRFAECVYRNVYGVDE